VSLAYSFASSGPIERQVELEGKAFAAALLAEHLVESSLVLSQLAANTVVMVFSMSAILVLWLPLFRIPSSRKAKVGNF